MASLEFKLTEEFIELHKLLKLMGLCEHGGAAKHAITEGLVKVNGVVETRKAFKTRAGHAVEYQGEIIKVS
jgi:ribosome-associated protein